MSHLLSARQIANCACCWVYGGLHVDASSSCFLDKLWLDDIVQEVLVLIVYACSTTTQQTTVCKQPPVKAWMGWLGRTG